MVEGPFVLFVGRWQPCHLGHEALIRAGMEKHSAPAFIWVRDIPPDEKNPFTALQTVKLLRAAFDHEEVKIAVLPDIKAICTGRGVGYIVEELDMPADLKRISATEVRTKMKAGLPGWRDFVSPAVASLLVEMDW